MQKSIYFKANKKQTGFRNKGFGVYWNEDKDKIRSECESLFKSLINSKTKKKQFRVYLKRIDFRGWKNPESCGFDQNLWKF